MRIVALVATAILACGPVATAPGNTPPPPPDPVQATATAVATGAPNAGPGGSPGSVRLQESSVPAGPGPHDVAPAADGGAWFTAQRSGRLGWLDPRTGRTKMVPLGLGSTPHGVIVGPDGARWITDGGLNAIVRVDPKMSGGSP